MADSRDLLGAGSAAGLTFASEVASAVSFVGEPKRKASWQGVSWLMLTDVVGTSVLTLPGVARSLGWVPTVVLIVCCNLVSVYAAGLMARTRALLSASLGVEPLSMGEAARHSLGGQRAAAVVYLLVYGLGFFGEASYLLTLGVGLQGVFYDVDLCLPAAVLVSALFCMPFCFSIRQLSDSIALCVANLLMIAAVLSIIMAKLWRDGIQPGSERFLVAEDLTFARFAGTSTNVVYAFAGQWLYFELMAEMRKPHQFMRVFWINAPVQIGIYLLVAFWGYYFAGDHAKGYFLDNIPFGLSYRVASGLLFCYVSIAFTIKNVVLCRCLHNFLSPERSELRLGEPGGARAQLEHCGCMTVLIVVEMLLANAVPFFDLFLGLIGGLLSGPISYVLPILFFLGARSVARSAGAARGHQSPARSLARNLEGRASELARRPESGADKAEAADEAPQRQLSPASLASGNGFAAAADSTAASAFEEDFEAAAVRRWAGTGKVLPWSSRFAFAGIIALVALAMVVGTINIVAQIVERSADFGAPFSCQPLKKPNVPALLRFPLMAWG
eukprot:TRINITY_DN28123_c0_g1_i1.p1 TRINITY_DN28123_c0_g1~~TRINITY_DN28123_c0_g1_i1.p1  ORF type:complete len:579 (-),score=123.68 TRINITY_DN28123_c0_g1_i1:60-1730(-)